MLFPFVLQHGFRKDGRFLNGANWKVFSNVLHGFFSLGPTTEVSTCLIGSTKIAHYFMVHWPISLEHELLSIASHE